MYGMVELESREDIDRVLEYVKFSDGMPEGLISSLKQATVSVLKEHHECLQDDTQSYWEYTFIGSDEESLACIYVNSMTEDSELIEYNL